MLTRVEQRTSDDCTIAVVATVMGQPYSYERVLSDRDKYRLFNSDGTVSSWWETYLWDSGYPNQYLPLSQMTGIVSTGTIAGIVMLAPVAPGQNGHLIAADEYGLINPSTGWPDRIHSLGTVLKECHRLGAHYEPYHDFLAVWLRQPLLSTLSTTSQ